MLKQLDFVSDLENSKSEKKMRLWIIFLILFTLLPSSIFWLISSLRTKQIPIGQFFKELDFSSIQLSQKSVYSLTPVLNNWAEENIDQLTGDWSIKIIFLEDEFSWQRYSTRKIESPSLVRLPAEAILYHQIKKNEDSFDDQPMEVGPKNLRLVALEWGMKDTDFEDQTTTAEDISLFLTKLYRQELLSSQDSRKVIAGLVEAGSNQITAGVPQGIRVAGETSVSDQVAYAAGIVYFPDNPFVLVIVGRQPDAAAGQIITKLVNDIYWIIAENIE